MCLFPMLLIRVILFVRVLYNSGLVGCVTQFIAFCFIAQHMSGPDHFLNCFLLYLLYIVLCIYYTCCPICHILCAFCSIVYLVANTTLECIFVYSPLYSGELPFSHKLPPFPFIVNNQFSSPSVSSFF